MHLFRYFNKINSIILYIYIYIYIKLSIRLRCVASLIFISAKFYLPYLALFLIFVFRSFYEKKLWPTKWALKCLFLFGSVAYLPNYLDEPSLASNI